MAAIIHTDSGAGAGNMRAVRLAVRLARNGLQASARQGQRARVVRGRRCGGARGEAVSPEPFQPLTYQGLMMRQSTVPTRAKGERATDLSATEQAVLVAMIISTDNETGRAKISTSKLGRLSKINKRTVRRTLQALESKGWLAVSRRTLAPSYNDRNEYSLQLPAWVDVSAQAGGGGTRSSGEGTAPPPRGTRSPGWGHRILQSTSLYF